MSYFCYNCHHKLNFIPQLPPGRSDRCNQCESDLRSCRMCQHYDKSAYNECREPNADRVLDKEKANFCDYYKFGNPGKQEGPSKEDLLAKANALFKK